MKHKIKKIVAREVLDSRGIPTVEATVFSQSGMSGTAIVPSGASTGRYEALELRDNNKILYHGKGVLKAVSNINLFINEMLAGRDPLEQREIDSLLINLDGTPNKSKLGANAILAVSLAVAKLSSNLLCIPLYKHIKSMVNNFDDDDFKLPIPMLNLMNGGLHANNNLSIQEFMIVPVNYPTFRSSIEAATEIMYNLKHILHSNNISTAVGDEGGFAPQSLHSTRVALDYLVEAIDNNKNIKIALDAAASTFYIDKLYSIDGLRLKSSELVAYYEDLVNSYPIISIEDPMHEEDYDGWFEFSTLMKDKIRVVGDDIFVTQISRLTDYGIGKSIANSILIKLNQVGTLSETLDTIQCAKRHNYSTIVSHRSGETEDTTISHLATAINAEFIKSGSLMRSERIAKYNELMRIEDDMFL